MWRVAFLLVLVFLPESGWAQGYQSKELAEAAAAYRQELLDSVPANQAAAGSDPAAAVAMPTRITARSAIAGRSTT